MSTFLVFIGILLVSLVVSFLAALQLADFFRAEEEFVAVMMMLVAAACVSLLAFGVAYAVARRVRGLAVTAIVLCVAVLVLVALPSIIDIHVGRAAVADSFKGQNLALSLELVVPAIIAVLVQWGLTRHRWLRVRGLEDLSLWPWVTTVIAGVVILNPFWLGVVGSAIWLPATDMDSRMAAVMTGLVFVGLTATVLPAMALIEYVTRRRMLSRRLGAGP